MWSDWDLLFQKIQEMEERRIVRIGESMKTFADVDRQVIPIIGKCLDEITKAAESVDHKNVSVTLLVLLTVIFELMASCTEIAMLGPSCSVRAL